MPNSVTVLCADAAPAMAISASDSDVFFMRSCLSFV